MKKLILLLIFLFFFSSVPLLPGFSWGGDGGGLYAQSYTFSLDTNRVTLTSIYNALVNANVPGFDDSITNMRSGCQYYAFAVKSDADSTFKVGFDTSFTSYFLVEPSPPWNYVGEFNASYISNVYFRKAYAENTAISVTVSFIKIVR